MNADGSAIDWSLVADNTPYTLIGTTTTSDFSNFGNFGIENAATIDGGRKAYFQEGSLQLIVVPEPSTMAAICLGALFLVARRRQRR